VDQPFVANPGPPVEASLNQAQALLLSGRPADAAALCRRVLATAPQNPGAHGLLALALADMGQPDAAAHAETALSYNPNSVPAHCALGFVHFRDRRPREALHHFRRAVEHWRDLVVIHNYLGLCHAYLGDYDQALVHYETALHMRPEFAPAHFNRAVIWLTQGHYGRGWLEFEWRWQASNLTRPDIPRPRWDGSDLTGKSILIHTEQGLGDAIQFVRLLPLLKQRGARVVFACQKALHELLSRCEGIDEWLPIDEPTNVTFDLYAPLASLPNRLRIDDHNVPRRVPYVFTDPARVERWREVIGRLDGLKVGICWQGSPTYVDDKLRSIPLRHFAALAEVPSVRLISLQKGFGEEQIAANRGRVPVTVLDGLDESGGALMDTAAVMQHLDLVVACNSSVVHLAGALGVPVWLPLSTAAEWHWLQGRTDSPWYPTLRLFWQSTFDDWDGVFGRMRDALRPRIESPAAAPVTAPAAARPVSVAVAPGELFDKLTILEIKTGRIADEAKLTNVRRELELLRAARDATVTPSAELDALVADLRRVNEELWEIEDNIRDCERGQDFGPRFVELARSVYHNNDRRAALKRRVNELLGSTIVEEKSYQPY